MDRLERALEKSRQARAAVETHAQPLTQASSVVPVRNDILPAPDISGCDLNEERMERNRIVAHHIRSGEADVYRQLRTQVLQIMNKSGFRTLAITSPHYGDGKTTIAINLAISMALDVKQTVLLVDLDLRKPSLHHYLGLDADPGLTDYLLKDRPLHECLARPPFDRVNTLPAGAALDNSSEILGSPKMIQLADELKNRYPDRIIIYDMPPVLAQDDPIAFLPHLDAVLVVVRDGVTKMDDLKLCLGNLSDANVIGTILNDQV